MPAEKLKNFEASLRKPAMKDFGLFPSTLNLDWIWDISSSGSPMYFVHPTNISGTMNGVNATFTLSGVTSTPATTLVIWNGVSLLTGTGFNITGGTITMSAGYIPESGDTLWALVWVSAGTDTSATIVRETPSGTINGVNNVFTLSAAPVTGVMVFRNGALQLEGTAYLRVGATITFQIGYTPQTGDVLEAVRW